MMAGTLVRIDRRKESAMSKLRQLRAALLAGIATVSVVGAGALAAVTPVVVTSSRNSALQRNVLVTADGFTLYHLTAEKKGKIACIGPCASLWPPLLLPTSGKATAGRAISAGKLGSIKRPDGRKQATYAGLPLYRYSLDKKPGQAKGQGDSGIWFAIAPSGKIIPTSPTGYYNGSTTSTTAGGFH
jgi:predicted lipoprotein with Yx(FWY)xxD motif